VPFLLLFCFQNCPFLLAFCHTKHPVFACLYSSFSTKFLAFFGQNSPIFCLFTLKNLQANKAFFFTKLIQKIAKFFVQKPPLYPPRKICVILPKKQVKINNFYKFSFILLKRDH